MITHRLNLTKDRQELVDSAGKAFPLIVHYSDFANWPEPRADWHWHKELELSIVFKGAVRVSTNHCEYDLEEGDGYFINRDAMHRMTGLSARPPILMTHLLDASLLSGSYESVYEQKYVAPILECRDIEMLPFRSESTKDRRILEHLRTSYEAADMEEEGYEFTVRNELSCVWLALYQQAKPLIAGSSASDGPTEARVKAMMLFIQDNHGEKLTLEQIARAASISPRECQRSFQQFLHMTPFEYLLDYRLHAAAGSLLRTSKSVTEISADHGFSTPSYFTKLFREKYRMSPQEYRREKA